MSKDLDKFQIELDRYRNVNFMKDVDNESAKAYGLLAQQKVNSEKSFNDYNQKIFKLNQKISEIEKELIAHQKTISTLLHEKESQEKFYKTREEKEIEKVICLENQVNVLDNIVYKTGQSVQTMNMLNRNCKTSFVKPELLKKAIRANPRLYDIGCYNDNIALLLAPASDETIHLAQESRSKLSDLIKPFDYKNLNNLYDLFVPQHEKSAEQKYFSSNSKMSYTPAKNVYSKEDFNKQTILLEKQMNGTIPSAQKCKSSAKFTFIKQDVQSLFHGVKCCNQIMNNNIWHVLINLDLKNVIEQKISPTVDYLTTDVDAFY
ncbi:hypothetical protein Tco_1431863 [Tanacetum coccineum]